MLIFDQLKKSDRHLQTIAIGVLLGLAILSAGLWYLQVISAKRYQALFRTQSFRTVRVLAVRGRILDRNHQPLADNRPSFNVSLYLEELRDQFELEYRDRVYRDYTNSSRNAKLTRALRDSLQREARYRVVSNLLFAVSSTIHEPRLLVASDFHKYYDSRRSLPLPLVSDLSPIQVAQFVERTAPEPSLALEVQPHRFYPHKTAAAHLLGHLRRELKPPEDEEISFRFWVPDFVGVKGLEWAFDDYLRGKAGVKLVVVNNMLYRHSEEIRDEPEPGRNVVLTLDLPIQLAAELALQRHGPQGPNTRGAVVVMDPQNGDLLAIASAPSFDPNEFMGRISEERWASLNDTNFFPMFNRAAYGTYAPGSVFKIITGLACLEAGLDPEEVYSSKGYFQLRPGGRTWRDTAGAGEFNFRRAFYLSSNPYFQNHGVKTSGARKIIEVGNRFKFGELTGVIRGLEARGYFPNADNVEKRDGSRWMDGDTANLAIGHGEIEVTPLQMAVMTTAVANGGKILKPRLVAAIEPQDTNGGGDVIRFPAGEVRGELNAKPEHLERIRSTMLDDVEYQEPVSGRWGTGHPAAVKGLKIAGKTGTAQRLENGRFKEYITWFVSFAPFEDPRYVVVAVVEGGGGGGVTCGPIARDIYQAILNRDRTASGKNTPLAEAGDELSPGGRLSLAGQRRPNANLQAR